ncbi:solute carrier family 52, riboflavin transporter, member 3-B-like [Patiria miniata]|uniref:Riboflavin transporter n=1 Tax=Patiria miniata TaxID=46514 RepID=A0A914B266_PATMI|nr:solute carrier family 52, riboflavin transporter, member 3-B-like [Patiria miniata]XP_038069885.1 solute carrier family 52, riboflavin transporter, member 3-B-like [Patiria miniata]
MIHETHEEEPLLSKSTVTATVATMETVQVKSPLRVRVPVVLLTTLFGVGSWIAINGLWVELPLLVSLNIPENYNLASYLTVIIQLANVGPLAFSLTHYFLMKDKRIEIPTVFIIVTLGCISSLLLIFFWDRYTVWQVDGKLHSTALLVLAFFLSIVDCTSSVAFTPFMSLLKSSYLTWYFIGEGLSSLLPSVMALIQGVGSVECVANGTYINRTTVGNETILQNCTNWISRDSPARFPPQDFFGFLFAMMLTCGIAFTSLNYLPLAKQEHIYTRPASASTSTTGSSTSSESHTLVTHRTDKLPPTNPGDEDLSVDVLPVPQENPENTEDGTGSKAPTDYRVLSKRQRVYLFAVLCFVCSLSNGALPSIQSFSCGPYGLNTYLLASTLANIANPMAATLVMLVPSTNLALVGATTLCGTAVGAYCMLTAVLSPTPPLQHEPIGSALIILAWITMMGFFIYTRATIAWILRTQPGNRSLLIWYGGVTQIGSLIGSFVMWPLVNVVNKFQPYYEDVCEGFPRCQVVESNVLYSAL